MRRLLTIACFLPAVAFAQRYIADAELPKVERSAFYSIALPPAVTSLATTSLANVRIVNEKNQEVPYISRQEDVLSSRSSFEGYEFKTVREKNRCSRLTLVNKDRDTINNLLLRVRNAEVVKYGTLRGSDDEKTWYALKNRFLLGQFDSQSDVAQLSVLDFPRSNYLYFQLTLDDSTSAPISVLEMGRNRVDVTWGTYVAVPGITFTQTDSSDRHTWVRLQIAGSDSSSGQYIDRLTFDVEGPAFYFRDAELLEKYSWYSNKKRYSSWQAMSRSSIVSRQQATVQVGTKSRELILKIDNGDNPPLKITGVHGFQLKRSLVTWLEPGHQYRVAVGGDTLQLPQYDLAHFSESIPAQPEALSVGALTFHRPDVKASTTIFTNRMVIWVAIIGVIVLLGFMTAKMLREKKVA